MYFPDHFMYLNTSTSKKLCMTKQDITDRCDSLCEGTAYVVFCRQRTVQRFAAGLWMHSWFMLRQSANKVRKITIADPCWLINLDSPIVLYTCVLMYFTMQVAVRCFFILPNISRKFYPSIASFKRLLGLYLCFEVEC